MRDETELQSVDRHFNELLQELRVAQTGVQILFAFLLGLAFTPRFPDLTGGQQAIYLVTLVLSAVSAALLIAPVGYHRTVFRQRLRPQLVKTGHRYAVAGLVLLLLALVGAVHLAASFVLGAWATLLAAALAGLFATLWFVIPLVHRIGHQHRPGQQDPDPPGQGPGVVSVCPVDEVGVDDVEQARTSGILRFSQPHDHGGNPCLPTHHPRYHQA